MKHHKLSHPPRKDRDYLLFEKRGFEYMMGSVLRGLIEQSQNDRPYEINVFIDSMAKHLENHSPVTQVQVEQARQLSWKYLNSPSCSVTAMLLIFLDALSENIVATLKPQNTTKKKR